MVIEEDDQVKEYLFDTDKQLEEGINTTTDLMWGIQDTEQIWENQIDRINLKLFDKATKFGLN